MDLLFMERMPPVTRCLVLGPLVLFALESAGIASSVSLAFVPSKVAQGELWRLCTGLFYFQRRMTAVSLLELLLPAYYASEFLEQSYYGFSSRYLKRVGLIASAALIICSFLPVSHPAMILYESLPYIVNHRRQNGMRVVLMNVIDVSEVASLLAPAIRGILFDENVGYCVLIGFLLGHILLVVEDILPVYYEQVLGFKLVTTDLER